MNRLVAIGLLAIGVLGGYLLRPPAVNAQRVDFPFQNGDSVDILYADNMSRPCVIDQFYGSFVTCKPTGVGFTVVERKPFPFVLNLGSAISVTLVKKAD